MSGSLEEHELNLGSIPRTLSEEHPPIFNPLVTFPRLHTCRLTGRETPVLSVLEALAAFPLTTLSLTFHSVLNTVDDSPLASRLKPHVANLTSTNISFRAWLASPNYPKFCDDRGIDMRLHDVCMPSATACLPSVCDRTAKS